MPRALWKGAISFGLVHVPVELYPAAQRHSLDLDWLDKRTLDPIGYKKINKATGREVKAEQIVKGYEYEKGKYVVLGDEDFKRANPVATQTVEILAFIPEGEVPVEYFDTPYYLAPGRRGEKVYALLREALKQSGKAGLARVVIHSKQHLAVLLPCGPALVLNLLRWGGEIRSWEALELPPEGKSAGIKDAELKMAKHLIEEMSGHWRADELRDNFHDAIMKLVAAKAKAGETATVEPLEEAPEAQGADVIDLTELLRRSLKGGARPARAPAPAAAKKSAERSTPWKTACA